MQSKRKVVYNATQKEKEKNLTFEYSIDNGKVLEDWGDCFVRLCDYPYSELLGNEVLEHYLLIPKIMHSKNMVAVMLKYQVNGFDVLGNKEKNKSVTNVFHLHLLKLK